MLFGYFTMNRKYTALQIVSLLHTQTHFLFILTLVILFTDVSDHGDGRRRPSHSIRSALIFRHENRASQPIYHRRIDARHLFPYNRLLRDATRTNI